MWGHFIPSSAGWTSCCGIQTGGLTHCVGAHPLSMDSGCLVGRGQFPHRNKPNSLLRPYIADTSALTMIELGLMPVVTTNAPGQLCSPHCPHSLPPLPQSHHFEEHISSESLFPPLPKRLAFQMGQDGWSVGSGGSVVSIRTLKSPWTTTSCSLQQLLF